MKQILVILILSTLAVQSVYAQVVLKNEDQITRYNAIPQERIFAHVNTSLFLTGEYLYYTVYCLNANTNNLSNLSKIGYVELISEDGEQLFKQKIKLKNGLGNGDFFIPVTIQTGSYKLLAYTTWMMNKEIDYFFQADIHIINPYQASKAKSQSTTSKSVDSSSISDLSKDRTNISKTTGGRLDLVMTNQSFKTRSKVSLTFKGKNNTTFPIGDYSISIRKKGNLPQPSKLTFVQYLLKTKDAIAKNDYANGTKIYVPELRGELLSGSVSTSTNNTIENLKIAASIPGENFYIGLAKTDINGNFYINIENSYEGDRIFLEILEKPQQDYKIVLKKHVSLDYSKLLFEDLRLDSLMQKEILQRSIHNQIDNAYYKFKPDSVVSTISEQLFDNKKIQSYKLDEFTRFKTVRETVFEIVKDVSISRINKSTALMRVQGYYYGTNSGVQPLVLLDGLQITNHTMLLDHNAFTIDEITIYRDRFVLGPKVYQGAILFKSKTSAIDAFQNDASLFSFNLLKPQVSKNYFTQRYDVNTISRIPDDRLQLLWLPHLRITEKRSTLDFFTSDVAGEFEIHIEGFTSKQEPVSIRRYFSVQSD